MKRMTYLLAPLLLLAIAILVGPRPTFEAFDAQAATHIPPLTQLEERVAQAEAAVPKLKPHNQARIVWADSVARTPYVLVYLHGFSASHKEGSPIHERFAQRYGCNLYLSRLAAHGIDDPDAFKNLEPAALVNSAKEAIARGKALGDSIILMSCSTGSTLSLYLAAQDPAVHSLIMYSPNIDIYNSQSYLLNLPWGKQLARTIFDGDYRQWSQDDSIGMFWTTRYHLDGMHALRKLVSETMTPATFAAISQPTFISYYYKDETHKDEVISIEAIHEMVPQLGTPPAQVRVVPTDKAGTHVISGDIMNPHWQEVEAATWSFAEEVLQLQAR